MLGRIPIAAKISHGLAEPQIHTTLTFNYLDGQLIFCINKIECVRENVFRYAQLSPQFISKNEAAVSR
jgi:hypothetical protein